MANCFTREFPITVSNKKVGIEFDEQLKSRLINPRGQALGDFESSDYILTPEGPIEAFRFKKAASNEIESGFGRGKEYIITGLSKDIEKRLTLGVYEMFPSAIFIKTQYKNTGKDSLKITGYVSSRYTIKADENSEDKLFWSFQGASYEERPDWVKPLKEGYFRKNFMGMNSVDYGGGIPLTDIWRKDLGMTVGHCETAPKLVSLPVEVSGGKAAASVTFEREMTLEPGGTLETVETFVMVHKGDFFGPMTEFRKIMERRGMKFAPINEEAYKPTWCSWGYERNFKVSEIYNAIPMVKKLGFKWICLDDGWQAEEGDCEVSKNSFPAGEAGIKEFVRKLHDEGFKVQLWWVPMTCDPKSKYYAEHPDGVILDKDGNKQLITWWNTYYLCPASEEVRRFTRETVRKILKDWDFDGLKIDGQYLNAAPLCYNEKHRHKRPEESYEAVPEFLKLIYDEAKKIKPDALIMFCPCGTCYSFYSMPYFDMPVASDPVSSWQVRLKGKVFKALMGADIPYNGDHVELSDNGCDFASTVGIGGVINTKFTWPVGSSPVSIVKEGANYDLTPEKEALYRKWIGIYNDKKLASGEYLGELYSFGYDFPECHAIKKSGKMYYAFYADSFSGEVELRGLDDKPHVVYDYVNQKEVARLGPCQNKISLSFEKYALLEVSNI